VEFKKKSNSLNIKVRFKNDGIKYKSSPYVKYGDDIHVKSLELQYVLQAIGPFNLDDYNYIDAERYTENGFTTIKLNIYK